MHVKSQPKNDFFGRFVFGCVVFWLSCLLVELSFGQVGFGGPVVLESLFGRTVAHSNQAARQTKEVRAD
jgi:hypothetical protein